MARCCGSTCACKVTAGSNVNVTGTGTAQDPFVISTEVDIAFVDNETFNFTMTGLGTPASPWQVLLTYASTATIDDLPDVNTGGAVAGEVLGFDGTDWVPVPAAVATPGAVLTDDSLAGDGSIGNELEVNEDPDGFLATSAAGLGLSDDGINSLNRRFVDSAARTAASPAPDTNTLSMLDDDAGQIYYWTGSTWAAAKAGIPFSAGDELLELSGPYVAGQKVTVLTKQTTIITDGSGDMDILSAADLTGYAGVLSVSFQETGTLAYKALVRGNTTKVTARAFRLDTGAAYTAQSLTGTVTAYLY